MGYVSDKYNKKVNKYTFKCDTPVYTKLEKLYNENGADKVYVLRALYLADKGEIPHPVAVTDPNLYIDLPAHMMDQVKEMRADSVLTDLINKKCVAFKIYTYESKKRKGECYAIDLLDFDTPEDLDDDLPFEVE